MRFLLFLPIVILFGCRCSGNNNKEDVNSEEDIVNDDAVDVVGEDAVTEDGADIPSELDMNVDAGDFWDLEAVEFDSVIDQLPPDCFTALDAPLDLIPPDWEAVLPDRDSTLCGGCCKQVTISPYDSEGLYDVWGNYIVYKIRYDEGPGDNIRQIRFKNINLDEEYVLQETVVNEETIPYLGYPAIFENIIVYPYSYRISDDVRRCELIQVELSSGTRETVYSFDIPSSGWCPGNYETIDLYGNYVVYGSNKNGDAGRQQIFLFNLETRDEIQLSEGSCCTGFPRLWKDYAVYFAWYTYSEEIYLYNIETGETTNVTDDDFDGRRDQRLPAVWENQVVYMDGPYSDTEQNSDILFRDLGSGETTSVCLNSAAQLRPDVFGDLIAWIDYRNDPCPNIECRETNLDIYYYRISTGREYQATSLDGVEGRPRIWENRIFFIMRDSTDVLSIFMKGL